MKIIFIKMPGSTLLSHAVARIVPSAVKVLTVVFGMERVFPLHASPPDNFIIVISQSH